MSYGFGTFGFFSIEDIPNPPFELKDMGIEKRNSSDYYFDNNNRDIKGYLFQYTLKGHGVYETNGQTYRIMRNQAFFVEIPADERYYCPENLGDDGWQYVYIHFEGTAVKPYYDKIIQKTGRVLSLAPESSPIQYLLRFHERLKNGLQLQPMVGSEMVFHFLTLLYTRIAYNKENYSTRTIHAIEQMENSFGSLDGINTLADRFGISLSHFTREFTKETGISPIQYLTNIRIRNAMNLLQDTELAVKEIAQQCGFSNFNYFGKTFKKHTGLTPYQYRKERR